MIRLLRSLCGLWGILPASYTLEGEVAFTGHDFSARTGGAHRVFPGIWRSEEVALKVMKLYDRDIKSVKKVRVMAPL